MRKLDTSGISISDVRDSLIDNGLDLNADITDIMHEDWIDHRKGIGDLSNMIYVHQVPSLLLEFGSHPELVGHSLLMLGPTAIGKTEAIRQGLEYSAEMMGRQLILKEVHVSQMGPVDAIGVPRERDDRTYWAPHEMWPIAEVEEKVDGHQSAYRAFKQHYQQTGEKQFELMPKKWFVHFHDEVTNPASPQIPHQLFPSWIGDKDGKMMAGHRLVDDFFVVLAGNRVEDQTNSIHLAASAVTRLNILEVVPHYGGWLQNYAFREQIYAGQQVTKVHPIIIAYLNKFNSRFAPQDMDQRSPMTPFPTPRNWKFVSDYLFANDVKPMREDLLRAIIAGRIGNATAQELFTFITHYKELPDVDKLMRGEEIRNFPKPNRPDLLMILGTHMVMKLNQGNAKTFMKYMLDTEKFAPEISAMTMKQLRPAGKLTPLVREWATDEFSKWTQKTKVYVF